MLTNITGDYYEYGFPVLFEGMASEIPNSEMREPKEIRRSNSERRNPQSIIQNQKLATGNRQLASYMDPAVNDALASDFGFRDSFGSRNSDFGLVQLPHPWK